MIRNAELQREWANQQKREMKAQQEANKEEEKAYAMQEEAILRMRGMLEDENNMKRAQYQREIRDENKRLAQEKRDREEAWRRD